MINWRFARWESCQSRSPFCCFLYRLSDVDITPTEWAIFFTQFTDEFLMGEDFNAHSPAWRDARTCRMDERLLKTCFDQNLHILNDGNITRYATTYSQGSAIDLSITNSSLFSSSHWEVVNEPWGSDHFSIKIEVIDFPLTTSNLSPHTESILKRRIGSKLKSHLIR